MNEYINPWYILGENEPVDTLLWFIMGMVIGNPAVYEWLISSNKRSFVHGYLCCILQCVVFNKFLVHRSC